MAKRQTKRQAARRSRWGRFWWSVGKAEERLRFWRPLILIVAVGIFMSFGIPLPEWVLC